MTSGSGYRRSKTSRVGEVALWACAGLVVFAAHAYAVALLLKEPDMLAADDAAPAAIMIELAPVPEATVTEEEQIVPDIVESEEVQSAAIEPLPQPIIELPPEPPVIPPPPEAMPDPEPEPITESIPEPMPEPLMELPPEPPVIPPPEVAEPIEEIEPIEEQVTAALDNVEVPLPVVRPPPPPEPKKVPEKKVETKKPEKKVAKKPPPPPPASKAAREAKAEVTQSNRTAAMQTSSGSGKSMKPADWDAKVSAHIRRRVKSVNQNIRQSVTVTISFSYDGVGNITSVSAKNSTGDSDLNAAAVSIIRRSSPLPAPPNGGGSFIQAFVFK